MADKRVLVIASFLLDEESVANRKAQLGSVQLVPWSALVKAALSLGLTHSRADYANPTFIWAA